jgi:hypothetical protein
MGLFRCFWGASLEKLCLSFGVAVVERLETDSGAMVESACEDFC